MGDRALMKETSWSTASLSAMMDLKHTVQRLLALFAGSNDALQLMILNFTNVVPIIANLSFREAPLTLAFFYLGIAQIAITPPPALKRALWGIFFRADLSKFSKSLF